MTADLFAEVEHLFLGEPALEERPRVDARRGVALYQNQVPAVRPARRMPEVLVADVIQGRRGLEARDVPTQLGAHLVRPQHGGYGIPPDQRADPAFQRKVSRVSRLPAGHNGVQVRGIRRVRHRHADAASLREQFRDQESCPLGALELRDRAERIDPLAGLGGIQIQLPGHGFPSAMRATSTSGKARRASPATLREGAPPDSAGYTAVAEPAGTGRSCVAATPAGRARARTWRPRRRLLAPALRAGPGAV